MSKPRILLNDNAAIIRLIIAYCELELIHATINW